MMVNLIIFSSKCFEHPSVHPQEDFYMQFYGNFSCIHISSPVDGYCAVTKPKYNIIV